MIAGAPPFTAESDAETLNSIKDGKYEFKPLHVWEQVSDNVKELIRRCLVVNPDERIDIWSIMETLAMVEAESNGAVYTASEKLGRDCSKRCEFQAGNSAIKAAFSMMADVITDEQVEALRSMFKDIDASQSGMVELVDCVERIRNMVKDNRDAQDLLKVLNGGLSGRVNYLMCLASLTDRRRHLRREA